MNTGDTLVEPVISVQNSLGDLTSTQG